MVTVPDQNPDILLDSRGFTLLEVIVAMAVLSIVMVTLFRLQASTVGLSQAVLFNQTAPRLAKEQMDALVKNGLDPDELPKGFAPPYSGYTWACDIREAESNDKKETILSARELKQLKNIKITIYSPDRNSTFIFSTWTYVPSNKTH